VIDKSNFKRLLKKLGFNTESEDILFKDFPDIDANLKADFKEEKLIYPTDRGFTISGEFTTNFTQKENFVVFECVHRLFEKGYKPQHIELEPKWTVGHGASGGRADIMVKDNSGKSLLIIECKTAGKEFDDEWKNTLINGGQIISYAKQAGSTQFVALYTSDFVDDKVIPSYYLITLKDNEKLLEELADKEPLSYEKAKRLDKEDIYQAWKETYAQDFATKGIFEKDILAYEIGKTKYSLADLTTISSNDIQGKYHQFATILRQHNVSGRENAFDKLVNLFLCKIVDETNNPEELKFYWKGIAYDSFFELQDRLQKLYQEGMKRFLGEDVTYIDNEAIDQAFRFFKNDPDATREAIKKYFRELKFFTNNDFAFIDVHNEKLFYQNAAVLLKIVKMLQDIQLKTEEENQFLGDMFEGFLDQGVKQSEGQFFTPMPIVKFILKSLPLEKIITESDQIPKVIDYACGAGHFLNEYAQEIKPILEQRKEAEIDKYFKMVFGIEKEYRLSKVSKVSAFMYGQDDINIVYADSLATVPNIKDNEYSLLVANPPYSVKGFLETLKESDRKLYSLIDTIEEKSFPNNNSIENFFIERAKQLLKSDGVAGIIVPPSILNRGKAKSTSKSKNIYVATRELLLKYFDIVAIVEFGSGTFGKTGTSTVTLFIRKKKDNPASADHYANRVDSWFKGDKTKNGIFEDEDFIRNYCDRIEIEFSDYSTLLEGKPSQNLLESDIFKIYKKEYEQWTEIKKLKKQKSFKDISKQEQEEELQKRFLNYVCNSEKDKLYYFILASLNPQNVIVVRSPSKSSEIKSFLGYEWSSAKGKEGIKYIGGISIDKVISEIDEDEESVDLEDDDKRVLSNLFNLNNITTPLYDPRNRFNDKKINYLIERNFKGESIDIPEELTDFVSEFNLTEMIDFINVDFNKSINLIQKNKVLIKTKWNLVRLGDITEVKSGGTPDTNNPAYWNDGDIYWATLVDTKQKYLSDTKKKITQIGLDNSNAILLPINTVIFSSRATIGEVTINKVSTTTNQGFKNFICDETKLNFEYLYYILVHFKNEIKSIIPPSTKYKEINTTDIKNFKIPLPPLEEQKKLVAILLKFENKKHKLLQANMSVEEFEILVKEQTEELINDFII
jgi:type I restriction enzyme M protein